MKPILFNTPMVQAILEGRKTQTRRAMKGQPQCEAEISEEFARLHNRPRYTVGDILYVRETFYKLTKYHFNYRADYPSEMAKTYKWQPSLFMPKEAARLFLRVKNVRAERLQNISKEDIEKEGVSTEQIQLKVGYEQKAEVWSGWGYHFRQLWDSIVKPTERDWCGWNANPWVWVYEFERIDKGAVNG